mmetsp:Transcript_10255/g.21640  ORF Transcript_10255/g.21640 Transcript_10255/m.21640 type:complete len:86 (+) Transcript_10255:733-990(+)
MSWNANGQTVTPTPTHKDSAEMKRTRRLFMFRSPKREIPDTRTLQKRNMVIPPSTDAIDFATMEMMCQRKRYACVRSVYCTNLYA